MIKLKAVIFDMDGLLIDSEPLWTKMLKMFLARRGVIYRNQLKKKIIGRDVFEAAKIVRREFGIKMSAKDMVAEQNKIMLALFGQGIKLMPGSKGLLNNLKGKYKLALCSSSPKILVDFVLKKLKVRNYFKVVVAGDEVKVAKPNPAVYRLTAKRLKLKPNQCLVLEDSINGVISAKKAGTFCLAVSDNRYISKIDLQKADRVFSSLKKINLKTIAKFGKKK